MSVGSGQLDFPVANLDDIEITLEEGGWVEGRYQVVITAFCDPQCKHITSYTPTKDYLSSGGIAVPTSEAPGCEFLHPELITPTDPFSIIVKCKDAHDKTVASQTIDFPNGIIPGERQLKILFFDEADILITPDTVEYQVLQADGIPLNL